ncbi:hypothetical protein COV93_00280 [Candidatus Woesearchaeota archaeon CG11_big_fil_rev_8_21_14_0_20_43_8]|nr:MAG: hypothetical protein COV93_00280 [Candidatus Woesearchaeota archaeon CG11_big_fil_rev_8_21_14_0_20_43_8]PIO07031.1 MAG: hypothetical protein COT47_01805 [Candidatus Woesearchaeota archaeon CG08_land_8_20_14_0_20_43_7]
MTDDYMTHGAKKIADMYKHAARTFVEEEGLGNKIKGVAKVMHEETSLEAKIAIPLVAIGTVASSSMLLMTGGLTYGVNKLIKYFRHKK